MNASGNKNLIIWSVDPMQDPSEAKNLVKELKTWARKLDCEVLPVSMISQATLNFPLELAYRWKDKLKVAAQASLNSYLKKTYATGFLNPELIFVSALSNRKLASEMAKLAERKGAQYIFANTRAKKTWNPFRLGGFAETLVATSRVPVLLFNPTAQPSEKLSSVLFPTDFSQVSRNALLRLEPLASAFKSKVLIYDQVETPVLYPSEFEVIGRAQAVNMESINKDIEQSRMKKGTEWSQQLQKESIKAEVVIQRQRKPLAADILDYAKKNKVSLIAIASRTGPTSQALLGGVVRDVLLQAQCPVLVFYRPKAVRKTASNIKQKANHKVVRSQLRTGQTEVLHGG